MSQFGSQTGCDPVLGSRHRTERRTSPADPVNSPSLLCRSRCVAAPPPTLGGLVLCSAPELDVRTLAALVLMIRRERRRRKDDENHWDAHGESCSVIPSSSLRNLD